MAELDNQLRLITLFQGNSDRAEWSKFLDEVKKLGYKQSQDFWPNPGGDASAMFKAPVVNDSKVVALKKKFGITGFGFENVEAGKNIKESAYVVGEKVKVWMGGGKKALGEVKKIAFGDGFYFVEVAGRVVSRSLHELEPFNEGTDKIVKTPKKSMSLDEAILDDTYFDEHYISTTLRPNTLEKFQELMGSDGRFFSAVSNVILDDDDDRSHNIWDGGDEARYNEIQDFMGIDESEFDSNPGEIDSTDDYLRNRRQIISREKGNMSVDEMVDEAMDMTETSDEYKFDDEGAPDFGDEDEIEPTEDELDQMEKNFDIVDKDEDEIEPTEDELDQMEKNFDIADKRNRWSLGQDWSEDDLQKIGTEDEGVELGNNYEDDDKKQFMMYLTGKTDELPLGGGQTELDEYEGGEAFVPVKDSAFILGVKPPDEFGTMYIRFPYGVYEYYNVPDETYEELMNAPSAGKYFHSHIRKVFPFALAKKYNKAYAKGIKPKFPKKEDVMNEDHLSSREERIEFIVDNADFLPMGTLSQMFTDNKPMAIEKLSSLDDDQIAKIYHGIELAMDEASVDYQMESVLDEEFSEGEKMEEGMDKEVVKEAKSTKRFEILAEDVSTVTNIAALKGYKVLEVKGELVESKREGVMNILVEKSGRRATIVYNDNANVKPWSWNGTHFNFMQEALDTVYVTTKQILAEGKVIERNELKENSKKVDQLMEQRKYASKTTKLSETEAQRRDARSKEILKKFMSDDLIKRTFDR